MLSKFQIYFLLALVSTAVATNEKYESTSKEQEKPKYPQPYKFGYQIKDEHGEQYRAEENDGVGQVKGSYGFMDNRGIKRVVEYIADKDGFRAKVRTNEPGTANENPAAVEMISDAGYSGEAALSNNQGRQDYINNAFRMLSYTDSELKDGFRAKVRTNEPGTANENPAAVAMISDAGYSGEAALSNNQGSQNYINNAFRILANTR